MANNGFRLKNLPSQLANITNFGIVNNEDLYDKKLGVSKRESDRSDPLQIEEYSGVLADLYSFTVNNADAQRLPFFNPSYHVRRDQYYAIAGHPEIEFILHTVTNEAIVYNEYQQFCAPKIGVNIMEDIAKKLNYRFNNIYNMYGFSEGDNAWSLFLRWLIEGYLAFEIVWDNIENPKNIEGFTEMDPSTLYESYRLNKKGEKVKVWIQKTKNAKGIVEERVLPDHSVVFIAWNKIAGTHGMIAYVERLQRSFNLLRTVENTRIAWNIMNSMFRLKIILPVGTKTSIKSKQAISTVMSKYREDLTIDHRSGIPQINGQPNFNFAKNIILPSRGGESPEISGIRYEGADLSDMDIAKYFEKKLQRDSWLPFSRFDREGGSGTSIIFSADGIPYDELQFYRFINRARSEFHKILTKPWYLQACADYPELKKDTQFKSRMGITYESNNKYELAKRFDEENKSLDHIERMKSMTDYKGKPIYASKFLMNKYMHMDEQEKQENENMLKEELGEDTL